MKCLILAAGQGSRLRSVAEQKPLAMLGGKPLIRHVMELAARGGATAFVIATGYRGQELEVALGDASSWTGAPVQFARNLIWERPNGGSVLAAEPLLDERFAILMSDHLFDPEILRRLIETADPATPLTLAVDYDVANPELDMDDATKVKAGADGRIVEIGKTIPDFNCIDTGIFLTSPALASAIRSALDAGGQGSLSEGVQWLADRQQARVFDSTGHWWLDVDDAAALAKAERGYPDFLGIRGK